MSYNDRRKHRIKNNCYVGICYSGIAVIGLYVLFKLSRDDYQLEPKETTESLLERLHEHYNESDFQDVAVRLRLHAALFEDYFNKEKYTHKREILGILEKDLYPWLPTSSVHYKWKFNRGIVITVGDDHVNFVLTFIKAVRETHQSNIPIFIYHSGGDDLSLQNRKILLSAGKGVSVQALSISFKEEYGNFVAGVDPKPFALAVAPCQQCILLDADTVMIQRPELLFEQRGFIRTGALFFKGRRLALDAHGKRNLRRDWLASFSLSISQQGQATDYMKGKVDEWQAPGVVVVDKARGRHFAGILAACYLCSHGIRTTSVLPINSGKESFWMGFEVAQALPYAWNRHYAGNIGWTGSQWTGLNRRICGPTILHVSDSDTNDGRPLWFTGRLDQSRYLAQGNARNQEMQDKLLEGWVIDGSWKIVSEDGEERDYCMNVVGVPYIPVYGGGVRSFSANEKRVITDTLQYYKAFQEEKQVSLK